MCTDGSSVPSCRTVCGFWVSDRADKIFLLLNRFLRISGFTLLALKLVCVCIYLHVMCVFVFLGLSELIHDNLTESKRTINLLQRMNIYQEVFLGVLYRLLPIQVNHHCEHLFMTDLNQTPMTRQL